MVGIYHTIKREERSIHLSIIAKHKIIILIEDVISEENGLLDNDDAPVAIRNT